MSLCISMWLLVFQQERFLTIKSNSNSAKSCWWVPLTMTSSSEANFNKTKAETWLNCKNNHMTMSLNKNEEWAIFNLQLAGKLMEDSFCVFPFLIFCVRFQVCTGSCMISATGWVSLKRWTTLSITKKYTRWTACSWSKMH